MLFAKFHELSARAATTSLHLLHAEQDVDRLQNQHVPAAADFASYANQQEKRLARARDTLKQRRTEADDLQQRSKECVAEITALISHNHSRSADDERFEKLERRFEEQERRLKEWDRAQINSADEIAQLKNEKTALQTKLASLSGEMILAIQQEAKSKADETRQGFESRFTEVKTQILQEVPTLIDDALNPFRTTVEELEAASKELSETTDTRCADAKGQIEAVEAGLASIYISVQRLLATVPPGQHAHPDDTETQSKVTQLEESMDTFATKLAALSNQIAKGAAVQQKEDDPNPCKACEPRLSDFSAKMLTMSNTFDDYIGEISRNLQTLEGVMSIELERASSEVTLLKSKLASRLPTPPEVSHPAIAAVDRRILAMEKILHDMQQRIQVVEQACRSHEDRLNNTTTQEVADRMFQAMNTHYGFGAYQTQIGHMDTALKQFIGLSGSLARDVGALQTWRKDLKAEVDKSNESGASVRVPAPVRHEKAISGVLQVLGR